MKNVGRVQYIDISKGIAIYLVVLGHICLNTDYSRYIYAFHIPLFFFISGIFCKPDKYPTFIDFVRSKAKLLLIPYASLYALSYLYKIVVENPSGIPFNWKPIIGFFYATDNGNLYPNGALWFLPALFVTEILFYGIHKVAKNRSQLLGLLFLFAIVGFFLGEYRIHRLPFSLNTAFMAVFFLGFGYQLKENIFRINEIRRSQSLLYGLLSLAMMGIVAYFNSVADMDYVRFGNPMLFFLGATFGIAATLFISKAIESNKLLNFLGVNSLLIMGLQFPVLRGVIKLNCLITNQIEAVVRNSFWDSFLCSIATMVIILPLIWVFNRYLYFLLGKPKPAKM